MCNKDDNLKPFYVVIITSNGTANQTPAVLYECNGRLKDQTEIVNGFYLVILCCLIWSKVLIPQNAVSFRKKTFI